MVSAPRLLSPINSYPGLASCGYGLGYSYGGPMGPGGPLHLRGPQAQGHLSTTTVGVDANRDGVPDFYYTGVDTNHNGIPDALEGDEETYQQILSLSRARSAGQMKLQQPMQMA